MAHTAWPRTNAELSFRAISKDSRSPGTPTLPKATQVFLTRPSRVARDTADPRNCLLKDFSSSDKSGISAGIADSIETGIVSG